MFRECSPVRLSYKTYCDAYSAVHGAVNRSQKSFKLVWRCHQLLYGFLAKGYLSPSVTSVANDNWLWNVPGGCAQISWHLPYSRGKPQKTSAMGPSDEGAVRPVIASNEVPFLQMRLVGSHSTSGREKEGIKERMGRHGGAISRTWTNDGLRMNHSFLFWTT